MGWSVGLLLCLATGTILAVQDGNTPKGRKLEQDASFITSYLETATQSHYYVFTYVQCETVLLAATRTDRHHRVKRGWWDGRTREFNTERWNAVFDTFLMSTDEMHAVSSQYPVKPLYSRYYWTQLSAFYRELSLMQR